MNPIEVAAPLREATENGKRKRNTFGICLSPSRRSIHHIVEPEPFKGELNNLYYFWGVRDDQATRQITNMGIVTIGNNCTIERQYIEL